MLDCITSILELTEYDYSLINIACVILYMSAKYDNSVAGLDFYNFFALLKRLDGYGRLLTFWDIPSSEINWPEMIFNRIEQTVFQSLPKYQINLISPAEVAYELIGIFAGIQHDD